MVESRDWLGRSDWWIQQNAVAAVADRRRRRRRRCAAYQVAPASDKKSQGVPVEGSGAHGCHWHLFLHKHAHYLSRW